MLNLATNYLWAVGQHSLLIDTFLRFVVLQPFPYELPPVPVATVSRIRCERFTVGRVVIRIGKTTPVSITIAFLSSHEQQHRHEDGAQQYDDYQEE